MTTRGDCQQFAPYFDTKSMQRHSASFDFIQEVMKSGESCRPYLLGHVHDEDWLSRRLALRALAEVPDLSILEVMRTGWQSTADRQFGEALVIALKEFPDRARIELPQLYLQTEPPAPTWMKNSILHTLAELRELAVLKQLLAGSARCVQSDGEGATTLAEDCKRRSDLIRSAQYPACVAALDESGGDDSLQNFTAIALDCVYRGQRNPRRYLDAEHNRVWLQKNGKWVSSPARGADSRLRHRFELSVTFNPEKTRAVLILTYIDNESTFSYTNGYWFKREGNLWKLVRSDNLRIT